MDRVKCYEKTDLAYHRFDQRIKCLVVNIELNTITDLIEYDQIIKLYESNNEYLSEVTNEVIENIKGNIYRFLNNECLEASEWINEISQNSIEYSADDLISFIIKFKKELLNDEFIRKILTERKVLYTNIVKVKEFQSYILNNFFNILNLNNMKLLEALILEVVCGGTLYSENLNEEDTYQLIEYYLNHECNLNYLPDIYNSKNKKINAQIRVMAMEKYSTFTSQIFTGENTMSIELEFRILSGKDETKIFSDENKHCEHWNFDKEILKYGYPNSYEGIYKFLLNDFGIFKNNKISVAHYSQDGFKGISTITYQGYNTYQSINHMFRTNQKFQLLRMNIFLKYLETKNLNIFHILNYFIELILKNGFYAIDDSGNYSNYSIIGINKHLCIQIESLLSQYACLKKYDVIRADYISLDSNSLDIKQIESLNIINNYVKNYTYFNLMNSQSMYSFPINNEHDKRLHAQIKEKQITSHIYHNLDEGHINVLNCLEEDNILEWKENKLVFTCEEELPYWEELFNTGALVGVNNADTVLNRMIDNGMISTDTNLFDKFEIEYFNYIFNNQSFNDALAIRNKYLHTGQVDNDEYEVNIILVKLLMEVIMKIHFSLNYK